MDGEQSPFEERSSRLLKYGRHHQTTFLLGQLAPCDRTIGDGIEIGRLEEILGTIFAFCSSQCHPRKGSSPFG